MIYRTKFIQSKKTHQYKKTRARVIVSSWYLYVYLSKRACYIGVSVERCVFIIICQYLIDDDLLLKLNAMPNVLITGHQAFLTEEALSNIAETTIYNLDCWDLKKETENELTEIN